MTSPHQLAARVLAGAHEIPRLLLMRLRHTHRHQLPHPQEPREPLGVAAVGLHLPDRCRCPQRPQLTAPCIKHTRNDLARVHVQPDPRTLSHTGASRNCGSTAGPIPTATRA